MQFDQAHDTIYVNDIHCWPFWAQTPGQGYLQWTLNNGVAINCLDVDNPMFSNIFALGYLTAINFGASGSSLRITAVQDNAIRIESGARVLAGTGLELTVPVTVTSAGPPK